MPKQRIAALDLRALVRELSTEVVGLRLANIYDLNSKLYVLKLSRGDEKRFVVLEAGVRCHLTVWKRDKNALPSAFCLRLRKFLRTKRLEKVRQLGADRIIHFQFGLRENALHLFVEFYVAGNVVLTDADYKILLILRSTHIAATGRLAVNEPYPVEIHDSPASLLSIPALAAAAVSGQSLKSVPDAEEMLTQVISDTIIHRKKQAAEREANAAETKKKKKSQGSTTVSFADVLQRVVAFAQPQLIQHCCAAVLTDSQWKGADLASVSQEDYPVVVGLLLDMMEEALCLLRLVSENNAPIAEEDGETNSQLGAFAILGKEKLHLPKEGGGTEGFEELMDDFSPVLFKQHNDLPPERIRRFPTFNCCLDVVFSSRQLFEEEKHQDKHKDTKLSKIERIQLDQQRRVQAHEKEEALHDDLASALESHLSLVDRAIELTRALVSTGADWGTLWHQIKEKQRAGHPIAAHFHSLNLQDNQITLLLSVQKDEEELDEALDTRTVAVPVDFTVSAFANVALLHGKRKEAKGKAEKTKAAAETVVKQMEKKAKKDPLQWKPQQQQQLQRVRKPFWFEKFYWFVTSENYIVVAGRDATQNDILFKRYMKKADIYVHADVHGAASCIVKNPSGDPVPPTSLMEAGQMSICRSAAWTSKIVTSAWWVYARQVSKTPPPGEYLSRGGFMIRGKRNFLPPVRLEMGYTLLFVVTDDSIARHLHERCVRFTDDTIEANNLMVEEPPIEAATEAAEVTGKSSVQDSAEEIRPPSTAPASYSTKYQDLVDVGETGDMTAVFGESAKPREVRAQAKKMSKAVRRTLKKGKEVFPKETAAENVEDVSKRPKPESKSTAGGDMQQPHLPRGKRTKLKRARKKYAEQSEEEFEMAQKILGIKPMSVAIRKTEMKNSEEREANGDSGNENTEKEADTVEDSGDRDVTDAAYPSKPADEDALQEEGVVKPATDLTIEEKIDADDDSGDEGTGREDEAFLASKAVDIDAEVDRIESTRREPRYKKHEKAEIAQILREEGAIADEEQKGLGELDALTGIPVEGEDSLRFCIPMCAPYSALRPNLYRYNIKLQPGKMRKGKAAQELMKVCLRQSKWEVEKELMRQIPQPEVIAALVSDMKIAMPGMQKIQADDKKRKKQQKKAMNAEKKLAIDD